MAWPTTDIGQFAQLQVQAQYSTGQQIRNSWHLWGHDSASPMDVADIVAFLASSWTDGFITAYRAMLGAGDTLLGVLMRQVRDPLAPSDVKNEGYRSVNLAGTGSFSADGPSEIAQIMKLGSDAAGRSAHGRVFLPYSRQKGDINTETFASAQTTRATAVGTELAKLFYTAGAGHAAGAAADFDLALYSNTRRAASLTQYGYRVTSFLVDTRVHWLRSRGPRG